MNTSINIATFPSREEALVKMLQSVRSQFDEVRVYVNQYSEYELDFYEIQKAGATKVAWGDDLTDNGKFYFLKDLYKNEYYFTADDDLYYPPTYREDMVKHIEEHKCIVTHHGRVLRGLKRDYYKGHLGFSCLNAQTKLREIDVGGTGVTAFDTRYFKPMIWNNPNLRMSDIIFALEAAKQNKVIKVMPHEAGYFKYLGNLIPKGTTIHETECRKGIRIQNKLADQIYLLRYDQE